jgi:hypothetical protein
MKLLSTLVAVNPGTISGNGSGITNLNASYISAGTIGAVYLPASGVTAATYTAATVTVDIYGRVTSASNGSGGAQGSQGITGSQGNQGYQGFQGYQGNQGKQGLTGQTGSYTQTFTNSTLSGNSLTVTHNLGIQLVQVSIYDNNKLLVLPNQITLTSTTQCSVDFTGLTPLTGTWSVSVLAGGAGIASMGPQGYQGYQGVTGGGTQGVQGSSGSTGPQGNQGSAGSNGSAGSTGPQGNQGTAGSTGSTGSQGNQGNQGSTGTGSAGPQGYQGVAGSTGPQGYQGYQGVAGSQGNQGVAGSTGLQGSAGSNGSTGPQGNQGASGSGGGTPGGSNTQIQYNNSGAFGGAAGVMTDGTNLNVNGQMGLGGTFYSNVAFAISGTIVSANNSFGLYMGGLTLEPTSGFGAFFQYVGGGTINTSGGNIVNAYGLYSEIITKTGSGTIANSYGGFFRTSSIASNNVGVGVVCTDPGDAGIVVQANSGQTADLLQFQNSSNSSLSGIDSTGAFRPPSLADSSANNGTIYYSTTQSKLVYKDSSGTVNNLY